MCFHVVLSSSIQKVLCAIVNNIEQYTSYIKLYDSIWLSSKVSRSASLWRAWYGRLTQPKQTARTWDLRQETVCTKLSPTPRVESSTQNARYLCCLDWLARDFYKRILELQSLLQFSELNPNHQLQHSPWQFVLDFRRLESIECQITLIMKMLERPSLSISCSSTGGSIVPSESRS